MSEGLPPEPPPGTPPTTDRFVVRAFVVLFCVWGVIFPVTWVAMSALDLDVPLAIIVVAVGLINFVLGFFGGRQIKL